VSTVANWILLTQVPDADEGVSPFVARINQRIQSSSALHKRDAFLPVHQHAGGINAFEADAYLLATNYFDYDEMVKIVSEETAKEGFVRVQLLHMGQEDEGWSFVELTKEARS
jgi:hypothetical protein